MRSAITLLLLQALALGPHVAYAKAKTPEKPHERPWYIRIDAGASSALDQTMSLQLENPPIYNGNPFTLDMDPNGTLVGLIGIGYQINPFFRVDLTVQEYMKRRFSGTCAENTQSFCPGGIQKGLVQTDIELINGYFEFNPFFAKPFKKIRPYVGGGLGIAEHNMTAIKFYQEGDYIGEVQSGLQVNFTGRVVLGAAYFVLDNLAFDLWYTFTYAGSTVTGHYMNLAKANNERNRLLERGNLTMEFHELYFGLRYTF